MSSRRIAAPLAVALSTLIPACNPYNNHDGEFYAGAVDPTNFPPAYVGTLPPGGTADQGGGIIYPVKSFAKGASVDVYLFPFSASQTDSGDPSAPFDPLNLDAPNVNPPKAYVFDPSATSAFPDKGKCVAPSHYLFDQRAEAYRHDEQGNIFTVLPDDPSYVPIVAQVPVTSVNEPCQEIKSNTTLLKRKDVKIPFDSDGKSVADTGVYLAWAIVDPGADVQPNGANGLGPQHWGWWDHYLIAYIDGGYIPVDRVAAQGMTDAHNAIRTQNLYSPTQIPTMDPQTMAPVPGPGSIGAGYDIVDAARGDTGYSPVCRVIFYTPDDPLNPKTSVDDLSAAETGSMVADPPTYTYCLQAQ